MGWAFVAGHRGSITYRIEVVLEPLDPQRLQAQMAPRHPRVRGLARRHLRAGARRRLRGRLVLADLLLLQDGLDLLLGHARGQEVLLHAAAVLAVRLVLLALLLGGLLGLPGLPALHGVGVRLLAGRLLLLGLALLFHLLELDFPPDAPLFLCLFFGALDCGWD